MSEVKSDLKKKPMTRFEWLDQFRGLVILLFTIQTVAWMLNGEAYHGDFPVLAPYLNHGYKYASFANIPPMITLIDIGQQIFIFLVGFMAAYSILSIKAKKTPDIQKKVWIRIIRRFLLLFVFELLVLIGGGDAEFSSGEFYVDWFFRETLSVIAWAGLFAAIVANYVEKADLRLIIGLVLLGIQASLYALYTFGFLSGDLRWVVSLIAHIGICIIATAFTGWMLKPDKTVDEARFRTRILPITFGSFIVMYLWQFMQWADHHWVTVPLAMMTIGICGIAILMFYKLEEYKFKVPGLSTLGKNMFILFLLEMAIVEVVYFDILGMEDLILDMANPFVSMALAGIVPILILWIFGKIFEKLHWYIRI